MVATFPQRTKSHELATESETFFCSKLPTAWTYDTPKYDYGVDFRIGMADGGQMNGQSFVVQLKANAVAPIGPIVRVPLAVSTLNYLRKMLEVAILVCYVAEEKEAYWMFLKDIPRPKDGTKILTVKIPRSNKLSENPWDKVADYVSLVHHKKLAAMQGANTPAPDLVG